MYSPGATGRHRTWPVQRNEGRNIRREGPDILRQAAQACRPLEVALATWGDVTFDYTSTDAPDAVPTASR